MNLSMVLGLLGGLVSFDWYAADGGRITKAGERLRRILEVFTSNPAMAVVTGALVTASFSQVLLPPL